MAGEKCPVTSTEGYCDNLSCYGVEYQEHTGGINLLCPDTDGVTQSWLAEAESFICCTFICWVWDLWEQNR